MKELIAIAIRAIIESAIAECKTENIAQRLSYLIPEDRLEMLINGVPSKVSIIDTDRFLDALSKRVHVDALDLRLRYIEVTRNFEGTIAYASRQTRYAKSEEDAKAFEGSQDYWNTTSNPDESHQFPFEAWKCDSCTIALNEEQLTKYGLEVLYI